VRRFIILDRDGTLIVEKNYLSDLAEVELAPGAAEALQQFRDLGFGVTVITNQSGVGRGYFDLDAVDRVHERIRELLGGSAQIIEGFYVCPHAPTEHCACRKPKTGLIDRASRELGFDATRSYVIGDKAADVELAHNAGAKGILVTTGYGAQALEAGAVQPDYVASGLTGAAAWIATQS